MSTIQSNTRSALLFFMSIAAIEGSIQFYYSIWWPSFLNLVLVLSGWSCLYSRKGKYAEMCSRTTLYIWIASALVGVSLGIYFVLHGHNKLNEWCNVMLHHGGSILSIQDETKCLPSNLASVHTFLVGIGLVFGLPFMYFAVKTVHTIHLEAVMLGEGGKKFV